MHDLSGTTSPRQRIVHCHRETLPQLNLSPGEGPQAGRPLIAPGMFGARNRKKVDVDARDPLGVLVRKGNTESVRIFFPVHRKESLRSLQKLSMGREPHPPDTVHPLEMFIEIGRNVFQIEGQQPIVFFFRE